MGSSLVRVSTPLPFYAVSVKVSGSKPSKGLFGNSHSPCTCCPQVSEFQPFVMCVYCRGQVLRKEMTLADSSDITVAITEPQTGRKEVTLPVKVRQPAHIAFPCQERSQPREILSCFWPTVCYKAQLMCAQHVPKPYGSHCLAHHKRCGGCCSG